MKEPCGMIGSIPQVPCSSEAIDRALGTADYPAALAALTALVMQVMQGERTVPIHQVAAWLDRFPEPWCRTSEFRLIQVWVDHVQHRDTHALILLDEMTAEWTPKLDGPRAPEAALWLLRVRSAQGFIYESVGQLDRSRQAYAETACLLSAAAPAGDGAPARWGLELPAEEAERLIAMDPGGSARFLVAAMTHFRTAGDWPGMARIAHAIGHQYLDRGEPAEARPWLGRALDIRQGCPGVNPLLYTLDSLGSCCRQLGLLDEAQGALEEALRVAAQIGSRPLQAAILTHLGDLWRDREEPGTALEYYRNALRIAEEFRDPPGMAGAYLSLSVYYRRQGQFGLAADAAAEASHNASAAGTPQFRETVALHQQIAGLLLGDEQADRQLPLTLERLSAWTARREVALGLWYRSAAASRAGDQAAAITHATEALALATRYRHLHLLARELPVTAAHCCNPAVLGALAPDALAGLIHRAPPRALAILLEHVPAAEAAVAAAGRMGAACALSVRLLGTFKLQRAGQEVELGSAKSNKVIALFKYLTAHRSRPISREQILDAIWPESAPEAADRGFEVTLSTLRKLIDPKSQMPPVLRRGRGYLINPDLSLDVDVERFRSHLERGRTWSQRGQTTLAVTEWLAAEAAYGGDFLAEDPYEDWATAERERLREQYLDLVLRLGEIALAEGQCAEAVERAGLILTTDSLREAAWRLLIRARARKGNRALAVRDFRRCAAALKQELGEEPMPETRELLRRIRSGESL